LIVQDRKLFLTFDNRGVAIYVARHSHKAFAAIYFDLRALASRRSDPPAYNDMQAGSAWASFGVRLEFAKDALLSIEDSLIAARVVKIDKRVRIVVR
jgi:hypothetical protein